MRKASRKRKIGSMQRMPSKPQPFPDSLPEVAFSGIRMIRRARRTGIEEATPMRIFLKVIEYIS